MLVATIILLASVSIRYCNAFTITIGASREKCFEQIAIEGQKLFGSYQVQHGGKMDINIKISDSEQSIVYHGPAKREGSFEFIASMNGPYKLCLNNKGGVSVSSKRISFAFHMADKINSAGLHASSMIS